MHPSLLRTLLTTAVISGFAGLPASSAEDTGRKIFCVGGHAWQAVDVDKQTRAYEASLAIKFIIGAKALFGSEDVLKLSKLTFVEAREADAPKTQQATTPQENTLVLIDDDKETATYRAIVGEFLGREADLIPSSNCPRPDYVIALNKAAHDDTHQFILNVESEKMRDFILGPRDPGVRGRWLILSDTWLAPGTLS